MEFKFQRHSSKLSFLSLSHYQSAPESLLAGYIEKKINYIVIKLDISEIKIARSNLPVLSPFISNHQYETFKICFLSVTVNPLLSPPGGLFISSPSSWGASPIIIEKPMVSVLHKELEYKVEKLKNKKVGGHAAEDQSTQSFTVMID